MHAADFAFAGIATAFGVAIVPAVMTPSREWLAVTGGPAWAIAATGANTIDVARAMVAGFFNMIRVSSEFWPWVAEVDELENLNSFN